VITDNESTVLAMTNLLKEHFPFASHLHCSAHIANLVLQAFLDDNLAKAYKQLRAKFDGAKHLSSLLALERFLGLIHRVPFFAETRWRDSADMADWLLEHGDNLLRFLEQSGVEKDDILWQTLKTDNYKRALRDFSAVVPIFRDFFNLVEKQPLPPVFSATKMNKNYEAKFPALEVYTQMNKIFTYFLTAMPAHAKIQFEKEGLTSEPIAKRRGDAHFDLGEARHDMLDQLCRKCHKHDGPRDLQEDKWWACDGCGFWFHELCLAKADHCDKCSSLTVRQASAASKMLKYFNDEKSSPCSLFSVIDRLVPRKGTIPKLPEKLHILINESAKRIIHPPLPDLQHLPKKDQDMILEQHQVNEELFREWERFHSHKSCTKCTAVIKPFTNVDPTFTAWWSAHQCRFPKLAPFAVYLAKLPPSTSIVERIHRLAHDVRETCKQDLVEACAFAQFNDWRIDSEHNEESEND